MPIRRRAAGLALAFALVAGLAPGHTAVAEPIRFDISVAGIPAGEMTLSASQSGTSYAAGGRIRATGLIGAVARLRFDGEASGRLHENGRIEPARYAAHTRSARSERDTEIIFENGQPARVSVAPPRSSQPDPAAQAGTVDPVSATYAVLRDNRPDRICNTRLELFDGSRRSQLVVGPAEARGGDYVCDGRYTRLEGEAHSVSSDSEWRFRLVFRPNGHDDLVHLQRIETRTRFGLAVVERRG